MKIRPADAAKECGVTVNTIRNWCKEYAQLLSPGAQPDSGNRELNEKDVEVFKYIGQLRKENMQKLQIVLRLRETSFGDVMPAEDENAPASQPTSLQESPQATLMQVSTMEAIARGIAEQVRAEIRAEIEPLKAQRLRVDVTVIAIISFILGAILASAWAWFR